MAPAVALFTQVSLGHLNKLFQPGVLSFIFVVFDFWFLSDSGL